MCIVVCVTENMWILNLLFFLTENRTRIVKMTKRMYVMYMDCLIQLDIHIPLSSLSSRTRPRRYSPYVRISLETVFAENRSRVFRKNLTAAHNANMLQTLRGVRHKVPVIIQHN